MNAASRIAYLVESVSYMVHEGQTEAATLLYEEALVLLPQVKTPLDYLESIVLVAYVEKRYGKDLEDL